MHFKFNIHPCVTFMILYFQSLDKILEDYDSLEAEFEKKKRSLEEQGVQNR